MNPSYQGKKISDPEIYCQTRHRDQGYKRVALLLQALETEACFAVLKHFSVGEVEGVLCELAALAPLSERERGKILTEFGCPGRAGTPVSLDGKFLADKLRRALQ